MVTIEGNGILLVVKTLVRTQEWVTTRYLLK